MRDVRVGVDIGGTFTDIAIMTAEGGLITRKVSSTVDNYARAISEGLAMTFEEQGIAAEDVKELLHGTTVASNAILELKGAKTGLITTKGFRDVLELRSLRMPKLYDLGWTKPPTLVDRALRKEVDERVNSKGEILTELDPKEVETVVDELVAEGVGAISICLLHSYMSDKHEKMIKDIILSKYPDMVLSVSSEVLPEIKEYERTSTTVINSFIKPVVNHYLTSLDADFKRIGLTAPVLLMQSNGGLIPSASAAEMPVHIIESGPAAGVIGAQSLAQRAGLDKIISFDMGGTTAKAALVEGGKLTRAEEYSVGGGIMIGSRMMSGAGYALKVPAIDLAEVGAGGGSIIAIDQGGVPKVGPESAGSNPGPVCYGIGGMEPTVTDANVALGYINPNHLAGGSVPIYGDKSIEAISEKVAKPLGLSTEEAAYGAHLVAAANMIRAIKAVSSERGRDPRSFGLVAFGGNGPLFAAGMAKSIGMRRVIIPPAAGVFSSVGLLYSDVEYHSSRTFKQPIVEIETDALKGAWELLETKASDKLKDDGFPEDRIVLTREAKLHYRGQAYELTVPVPDGPLSDDAVSDLARLFEEEHERTYGHRGEAVDNVELVSLNLKAVGQLEGGDAPASTDEGELPEATSRKAYFGGNHGWMDTPVIKRQHLAAGPMRSPLIIEEYDSTGVVPPGMTVTLDSYGSILIDIDQED